MNIKEHITKKFLSKIEQKIKNNKAILKEITDFETNIKPSLCKSCQIKLNRVNDGNILNIVSKGQYFCKECNNKISKKASEVFIKL